MLGDLIESALTSVGITSDKVESWLGKPCGCKERQAKLNQLTYWAKRIVAGKTERAYRYLTGIIGLDETPRKPNESESGHDLGQG